MTRSSTLLLLLLAPLSASAFTVLPSQSSTSTTAIFMSDSVDTSKLVLTGNNIDLTDSLKEHAEKRIGGLLDKLGNGGLVKECEIHLSVSKNPSVRAQIPGIKYYRVVYNYVTMHATLFFFVRPIGIRATSTLLHGTKILLLSFDVDTDNR